MCFPAAVVLHVTIDLLSSRIDYLAAGDYKATEGPNVPKAETLKNILLLTDAGYFDRAKIIDIDIRGG
jgi:hypothetical protein